MWPDSANLATLENVTGYGGEMVDANGAGFIRAAGRKEARINLQLFGHDIQEVPTKLTAVVVKLIHCSLIPGESGFSWPLVGELFIVWIAAIETFLHNSQNYSELWIRKHGFC